MFLGVIKLFELASHIRLVASMMCYKLVCASIIQENIPKMSILGFISLSKSIFWIKDIVMKTFLYVLLICGQKCS